LWQQPLLQFRKDEAESRYFAQHQRQNFRQIEGDRLVAVFHTGFCGFSVYDELGSCAGETMIGIRDRPAEP
jgi:hypothetical protein